MFSLRVVLFAVALACSSLAWAETSPVDPASTAAPENTVVSVDQPATTTAGPATPPAEAPAPKLDGQAPQLLWRFCITLKNRL